MKKSFNKMADVKKLSDEELLDLVQSQTLKYFTDFAHPVSGMARERSNPIPQYGPDCVATGGTGFGIMALIAGAERGWLSQDELLERITKIVTFLDGAEKYHGVFPHFINGNTGKTIPFSRKDDGGDLVETSFLMVGLLTARQYLAARPEAAAVSATINKLWENVEWDWHTKGGSDKLYWHWSPQHGWDMSLPIAGWNECLITYLLAVASPTHPVSPRLYEQCWAQGTDFKNGNSYDGIRLPLGPAQGGPLFLSHYSFLGLNPEGLKDKYADYWKQNRNHALINRAHCIKNPHNYKGYGADCWGLTSSDKHNGYAAHSPANDTGVISPTAALSSFPYTPRYSMKALRHFYEGLGDKIWGKYGFTDAFNENSNWYANSYLAIDQGPAIVMIENHRSGLLWKLFMSCPEVKPALKNMNFKIPKTGRPPVL
jgi:hypothetical protein